MPSPGTLGHTVASLFRSGSALTQASPPRGPSEGTPSPAPRVYDRPHVSHGIMNIRKGIPMQTEQHFIFANINRLIRRRVWWIDIPVRELKNKASCFIDFLLVDYSNSKLHHLRVPKEHFLNNLSKFSIKKSKLTLELSATEPKMFQDVRPRSGNVMFRRFRHCSKTLRTS